MISTRTTRSLGLLGSLGGACLVALAAMQMANTLSHSTDTALSIVGFVGIAGVLIALLRMHAAPSRVGRAGLWIWVVGVLSIPAGAIADQAFGLSENANLFYPIGGLGQLVGGLVAGIAIARAGVLDGWLRWAPLAWAVTYAAMMPFGFTDSSLSATLFAVFGLVIIVTSLGVVGTTMGTRAVEHGDGVRVELPVPRG